MFDKRIVQLYAYIVRMFCSYRALFIFYRVSVFHAYRAQATRQMLNINIETTTTKTCAHLWPMELDKHRLIIVQLALKSCRRKYQFGKRHRQKNKCEHKTSKSHLQYDNKVCRLKHKYLFIFNLKIGHFVNVSDDIYYPFVVAHLWYDMMGICRFLWSLLLPAVGAKNWRARENCLHL